MSVSEGNMKGQPSSPIYRGGGGGAKGQTMKQEGKGRRPMNKTKGVDNPGEY
jgi:hypothetical protein